MEPKTEEILTISEIAVEFKVGTGTVKGWIQRGELKATKFGHHTVRVSRKDLEEFQADRYGAKYFMTKEEREAE